MIPTLLLLFLPLPQDSLHLGSPFGDHMVLQRDRAVPVWGTAAPDTDVVVTCGGQRATTRSDGEGRWRVALGPLAAGPAERS